MSLSPAHQKHPEHKISEQRVADVVKVKFNGRVVAESEEVVRVDEDRSPPRYYFPRSDVRMEMLTPTGTTSVCPFKGTAKYFDLDVDGQHLKDAVWSYETPYDEHQALTQMLAFYDDKYPAIAVSVGD